MLISILHPLKTRTNHEFEEVDVVGLVGLTQVLHRLDLIVQGTYTLACTHADSPILPLTQKPTIL